MIDPEREPQTYQWRLRRRGGALVGRWVKVELTLRASEESLKPFQYVAK